MEHQDDVKGEEDMAAKKAALLQKRLRREREAQERKQQQEQDQEQKKEAARSAKYLLMYIRLNVTTKCGIPELPHVTLDPALVQAESRGRAAEEGGRESKEGVHPERVLEEEAAQADGGHGRSHQAAIWESQEEAATQIHPPGRPGVLHASRQSHR